MEKCADNDASISVGPIASGGQWLSAGSVGIVPARLGFKLADRGYWAWSSDHLRVHLHAASTKRPSTLRCIPGAAPPLMGWTTVTNSVDLGGLSLFAVLFLATPHFLAISLYLKEDYVGPVCNCTPLYMGSADPIDCVTSVLLIPATLSSFPSGLRICSTEHVRWSLVRQW